MGAEWRVRNWPSLADVAAPRGRRSVRSWRRTSSTAFWSVLELKERTAHTLRTQRELSARLAEIGSRGHVTSDEQLLVRVRSAAGPVLVEHGAAIAATSLARPTSLSRSIDDLVRDRGRRPEGVAEPISTPLCPDLGPRPAGWSTRLLSELGTTTSSRHVETSTGDTRCVLLETVGNRRRSAD